MINSKKAQSWGFDIMIAVMIFSVGLVFFYFFSTNSSQDTEEVLENLNYEGNNIADSLLSSGFPEDWNNFDVIRIGITDGNSVNETKLQRFYELASSNYSRTKSIFNINSNYYISMSENMTISNQSVQYIGNYNSNPENIIKLTRIVSYNKKPIALYVQVWK